MELNIRKSIFTQHTHIQRRSLESKEKLANERETGLVRSTAVSF